MARKRRYEPWRDHPDLKAEARFDGKGCQWLREQGRQKNRPANQQQQKNQHGAAAHQDHKEHSLSAKVEQLKARIEKLRLKVSASQRVSRQRHSGNCATSLTMIKKKTSSLSGSTMYIAKYLLPVYIYIYILGYKVLGCIGV